MRVKNSRNLLVMALVAVVISSGLFISLRTAGQTDSPKKDIFSDEESRRKEATKRFPTVSYFGIDRPDAERGHLRAKVNARYDDRNRMVSKEVPQDPYSVLTISDESPETPLPVNESDLVIVGSVIDAAAHLSNNKRGIYSEFSVRVDEVLKSNKPVKRDEIIHMDREGGFIDYGNGIKRLHRLAGRNMPKVGQQYVFFLVNTDEGPNYEIINGYELFDSKVSFTLNVGSAKMLGLARVDFLRRIKELVKGK